MLSTYPENMESSFNELKFGGGCSQKILNAENGLTFCIQVGEESLQDGDGFSFYPPQLELPSEPTISVVEEELQEEAFASHEIVAEAVEDAKMHKVKNLSVDKTGLLQANNERGVISSGSNISNDTPLRNGGLWKCDSSQDKNIMSAHNEEDDGSIWFNIKKRKKHVPKPKLQSGYKAKKTNDVMSVVLKNMVNNKKRNYSGMKMMINPKTGNYVIRSNYVRSNLKESFNVEPWMLDRPQIMQQPKDKLFVLTNNSKLNPSGKPKLSSGSNCKPTINEEERISPTIDSVGVTFHTSNKQFVKEEREDIRDKSLLSDSSTTVYWEEGNINKVSDFISLSVRVKELYTKSSKFNPDHVNLELPEYLSGIQTYESPIATKSGAAPGVNTFLSWEAVKERIEEIQEETMTKFIFDYKTPTFKDDPQPFKKIHFELDTIRKEVEVIIPNSGVPFIFLGICVYSCHLGKKRWKTKETLEEDVTRPLKTKKIGCPAILSVSRIARFPDFDISNLAPNCETEVLNELKDAWDFNTSRVRYYIEYHLRDPKASDHKGHEVQYLMNSNRFKEPVDPRILDKIRELTRQGYTGAKMVHQKVEEFIKEELFKGEGDPPLNRRRYNPSRRDIRYAIFKAKEELKKEGKSLVQLQCSALASEISHMVKDITHEQYLTQLKSYLTILWKTVKSEEPLESLLLLSNSNIDSHCVSSSAPTTPKRTPKKRKSEECSASAATEKDFIAEQPEQMQDHVIEQFYINVPEANENVFNAQLYAQELVDINAGLVDPLQLTPEDSTVTEVYYYYPDGTCELATPDTLSNVQT